MQYTITRHPGHGSKSGCKSKGELRQIMDDQLVILYDIFQRLSQSPHRHSRCAYCTKLHRKRLGSPKSQTGMRGRDPVEKSRNSYQGRLISRLFFFFQLNLPSGTRTTKDRGPGHHRSFQRACTVRTKYDYWGCSWRKCQLAAA